MKKILGILLVSGLAVSCGKKNTFSNDFGTVAFINASPGTPSLTFYVDTIAQVGSAIPYRSSSGYLSVAPGTRNIEARGTLNNIVSKYIQAPTETFTANTASTYIIYDTVNAGKVRAVKLTDDLSLPAAGNLKVRFVNVAPNSNPVDVTFIRYTGTSQTPVDSVTLTNRAYIGATPSSAAIQQASTFTTIPIPAPMVTGTGGQTGYIVRVKAAGTGNVLLASAFTTNTLASAQNLAGIVTFYVTGTAQGQPLALSSFRHYP